MENTPHYGAQEFLPVDESPQENKGNSADQKNNRKGYQNTLFPNDSITEASGFINEVRCHEKDGEKLFFVRVGLIQGSRKNDEGNWEGDIANVDLLIGSTLKKWAETMIEFNATLSGLKIRFVIRNLKFSAGMYENKPVLNSRGILEEFTIGHLDR